MSRSIKKVEVHRDPAGQETEIRFLRENGEHESVYVTDLRDRDGTTQKHISNQMHEFFVEKRWRPL